MITRDPASTTSTAHNASQSVGGARTAFARAWSCFLRRVLLRTSRSHALPVQIAMAARDDDRELEKALLPGDEAAHDADDSYGRGTKSTAAAADSRPPVGVAYATALIATWMALRRDDGLLG